MKTVCDVEKSVTSSIPRLEEIFSICEARIPFLALCNEVNLRNF